MISIFIQTLNEEDNLPRCLECFSWSDDIVILDSFSSDRTLEIAKEAGARVFQRQFDGRANNYNWAVENIDFKYPWVYCSDADEIAPPELIDEILAVTSDPDRQEVVFRLRFKNMLFGKWTKKSAIYPTWVTRLWKPDKIRWERDVNCITIEDGPAGYLDNHFYHYSFNKGFHAWFEKHNRYSGYEAGETIKELKRAKYDWRKLFSKAPEVRRYALKKLSFRIPFRPSVKFIYMYFFRLGFLDGRSGLTYCILQSVYEYMIDLKVKEMQRIEKGLPV